MDFEALLSRYKEAKTTVVRPSQPVEAEPMVEGRKKITARQLMDMIAERQAKNREADQPPPPPPPEKPPTPPPPDPTSFLFAGIREAQRSISSILETTSPVDAAADLVVDPPRPRVIDTTDIGDHTAMFDSAPAQVDDIHAVVNDIRQQVRTEETQKYMSRIEIEDKVRTCEKICREMEDSVRQVKKRLYQIDLHFSYIRQIMAVDDEELQMYVDDMSANEKNIDDFYAGLNDPQPRGAVIAVEDSPPPRPPEPEEEEPIPEEEEQPEPPYEEEEDHRFIVDERVSQLKDTFLFRPVPVASTTNRSGIMASSHDARFFSRFI